MTSSADQIARVVQGFGEPRIAVLGDLMFDEYVWGEVERISPEAPIPVLRVSRRQYRAGGAGSVIVNLARLGAKVSVFSLLGRDAAGEQVAELFRQEGCDLSGLLFEDARRTTVKSRHMGFVQQSHRAVQQMLRVDEEERQPIPGEMIERLLERLRERRGEFDALLVSDYNKGLIDEELLRGVMDACAGTPVLIDPARLDDYSRYRGAYLICPNRFEAERATGISCRRLSDCSAAGARLVELLGARAVAITLDREGILLCPAGAPARPFPTRARKVADVTGAGDMVLSILGWVVAGGGSLERAVELANVAAGIEVRHLGVTPISRQELIQEVRYRGHPAAGKIKSFGELVQVVDGERSAGKRIVFTNGCFDFLHLGHHHLLDGARQEGDLLVVAVNSDDSIRRLKGEGRPRILEEDRVRMLAGLEAVDYVTVFEEDTPNHLLEALRPDVLVKGSEYRDGVVVGREIVEGYGGQVAFVDQIPGISTTELLKDH
ncbi:MAG: bifunctional heptose 7-phosphate kinase/heptose 1-phosphate adenyltransferase [Planctomycetota bacterium]|nr:bifunctional heptose 7-phosphate kinase/heptose 1-phosphate adenyltransferase [Planctomycetota bacterium]